MINILQTPKGLSLVTFGAQTGGGRRGVDVWYMYVARFWQLSGLIFFGISPVKRPYPYDAGYAMGVYGLGSAALKP